MAIFIASLLDYQMLKQSLYLWDQRHINPTSLSISEIRLFYKFIGKLLTFKCCKGHPRDAGEGEITTRSDHLFDTRAGSTSSRYSPTSTQQVVDFGSSKYFSAKTFDSEPAKKTWICVSVHVLSIHLGLLASSFLLASLPTFGWEWIKRHFLLTIVATICRQNNFSSYQSTLNIRLTSSWKNLFKNESQHFMKPKKWYPPKWYISSSIHLKVEKLSSSLPAQLPNFPPQLSFI